MTSDESRLAVLETKMDTLDSRMVSIDARVASSLEKIGELLERHNKEIYDTPGIKSDLFSLKQIEADRRRIVNLFQAAVIGHFVEVMVVGFVAWMALK